MDALKKTEKLTWETDIESKCADEEGAFQDWIPRFIIVAIGFHHYGDEISSELSSTPDQMCLKKYGKQT